MNKFNPMHKIILSFSFILCFTFTSLVAQQLDHVLGDIIIQTSPDANIRQLSQELQLFSNKQTKVSIEAITDKELNIYLLKFDYTNIDENAFLKHISRTKDIELVQFNKLIQLRQTPNDPDFGLQWHLLNDGTVGQIDADIDADFAWDITTGGPSADGDEIVVAVLDNGIDLAHPDLVNALWKNTNEIPNNNIDDDNNGFIDDYDGWNISSEDDNVNTGNHGTRVAGVIGAEGNNGIGVTGVAWDIKLMIVKIPTTSMNEARALEGYSYVYKQRQLYNQTNGASGAFVVATNSSWGINNAQAADSPIWCAFYDSLGQQGIVNVTATTNNDVNVDIEGDMPTTCTSDFMVAVTSTNESDVRAGRGYGIVNIDIAAPGENIYTTNVNGAYISRSGTSFAAPQVAGIIGLLYSTPCNQLIAMAKNSPKDAATFVLESLYNGVDPIGNLLSEVATGGRVNANRSLLQLVNNCSSCPAPFGLSISNATETSAELNWISSLSDANFDLQWIKIGDDDWTIVENVSSPYTLSGLSGCANYRFQIRSVCDNESSIYTESFIFTTDGCCQMPDNITIDNVDESSARINWQAVTAAQSYNVRIKSVDVSSWMDFNTTDPSFNFTDLSSCTEYEAQVQTVCDGELSNFSPSQFFQTINCGSCQTLEYCIARATNVTDEWIESISIGDFNSTTGNDDGYGDYTGTTIYLARSVSIPLTLTPGYGNFPTNEYFKIWIDYDQDGTFDEASELVYDAGDVVTEAVSGNFTVPSNTMTGNTRMRISMRWMEAGESCGVIDFGEIEDYCVSILEGNSTCIAVENIVLNNLTSNSATIQWDPAPIVQSYNVRYREIGSSNWNTDNADAASFTINNLSDCQEYELQIQTNCDGTNLSDWSDSFSFYSECPCNIPNNPITTEVMDTRVSISWSGTNNAVDYTLQYRPELDNFWTEEIVTGTSTTLDNLFDCTKYEFRVRSNCPGNPTSYSSNQVFITNCLVNTFSLDKDINYLNIYPNPFQHQLYVDLNLKEQSSISFQIYNTTSQIVSQKTVGQLASGEHQILFNEFEQLSAGIYFIQIKTDKATITRKIIKKAF